ncbi:MAG: hypothetical protein LBN40_00240 [Oscillospiraceae bacterium]|jgi:YbbR domain-containing protein|nr:hypothetical protein [Oscillospiraceae bacterium]
MKERLLSLFRIYSKAFVRNLQTILLSLLSAIFIWFAISLQIFPDIPAHVDNIPVSSAPTNAMEAGGLYVKDGFVNTVSIQIQGKRYDIGGIDKDDFSAKLDLSGVTDTGVYVVDVKVVPLENAKCEIISPVRTATITVERTLSKEFKLTANLSGIKIDSDMSVDNANLVIQPETVVITGEQSVIDTIGKAEVRLAEATLSATAEVKGTLVLYNKDGAAIESPDVTVNGTSFVVRVPIHKVRELPLSFLITGAPQNFDLDGLYGKMSVSPGNLTVSSPDNSIDNLETLSAAEIPLSELTYEYLITGIREPLADHLAEGWQNLSNVASASISFSDVDDYSKMNFTVTADNFFISNAPSGYEVALLTKELNVQVVGPSAFIQGISGEDITVSVNLLGVESADGVKQVGVTCRIGGTKVPAWTVGSYQADVSFTAKSP